MKESDKQGGLSNAECAEVLRAMGNETRLSILRALFERERSVSELCEALSLEQHFASRHLAVLRHAGLVRTCRDAQRVIYSLHPSVRNDLAGNGAINLGCCELRFPSDDLGADPSA